ncbi:hypothetical protein F5Y02DRAFT_423000 [Annulohypoxylon stygium]|nr:hypothetical protein F5Y02DRAFT_423000 [Annulohypoxylon stygium]
MPVDIPGLVKQAPTESRQRVRRVKQETKYEVSLRQLKKRINIIITNDPPIQLPTGMKVRLQRTIDARQRCLEWYLNTEHGSSEFDIDGHRYFIEFLKNTQRRFDKSKSENLSTPKSAHEISPKSPIASENRFAKLAIDDDDDGDDS